MLYRSGRLTPRAFAPVLSILFVSSALAGADFLSAGGGARSAASGGIYLPSSDNVMDAISINPAGLALIGAPRLDLAVEGGYASGQYINSVSSAGRLSALGAVPYGAFGMQLGSHGLARHFSFGVGVMPEILSSAKWNYIDPPGGAGGVSYGHLNSQSAITAYRAAAGLGIYLGRRVQLGVTIGATYNTNTLQTAYVFQNYAPLAGLKTLLDLHTAGTGWNGTAGALVRATNKVQLSAAYHSKTEIRSTGVATGNAGVQFAAIGLGAARPDFRYNAEVDNVLPQSVLLGANWQATSKIRLAAEVEWINWSAAFQRLPVILTQGNNADINGLLGTNAITDSIPLQWHDQIIARVGIERPWLEHATLRAGYSHASDPVPSSTLSPLTAAITRHTISAGTGYSFGRWRFDAAYSIDPAGSQSVGRSLLRSGEYSNTTTRVGTQALILTASFGL